MTVSRVRVVELEGLVSLLEAKIAEQGATIAELQAKVAELTAANATLMERLGKNSRNSSKPPSMDLPGTRGPSREKRKGLKRGGQPGHEGKTRALLTSAEVDEVVVCRADACEACGALLMGLDPAPFRHQVWEVPEVKPTVKEYQRHALTCLGCGHATAGVLPEGVTASVFGARAQGIMATSAGLFRLSKREVRTAMALFWSLDVSLGSVSGSERRMSAALALGHEAALAHVRDSEAVHADETSWQEAKRRAWLWMAATQQVAVFLIQRRRDKAAAQALLGKDFAGWVCTDDLAAYRWLKRRGLCWAHLLRHFEAMIERGGAHRWYGARLAGAAKRILALWTDWHDGKLSRQQLLDLVAPHRATFMRVLGWAKTSVDAPSTGRQCAHLWKLRDHLWTFLDIEAIPPTNNHGERCLRHSVLWRKGCFSTDSPNGSRFVERILTAVISLKLQGRNVLDFLVQSYQAHFSGAPTPSLLPSPLP